MWSDWFNGVVMNEPTTADSSTSKHTDMASVMQGKGADTAWTQECRHNNMDTGMQTQHAWWWIVCMQASRCNAMCGAASSVCVWCCVCCAVQGCQWITLCQHSPALAALVLAVGSVVYNSKENNNRENNTEDAVDQ